MLETNPKYELGYHLVPELEESEIAAQVSEIEKTITQNAGNVLHSNNPQKKHLSYPIKQRHYAYFGTMEFEAPAQAVQKINAQLNLQDEILRHLLIYSTSDQKALRSLAIAKRKAKMKSSESIIGQSRQTANEKQAEPGAMEKQLEDVIEKI